MHTHTHTYAKSITIKKTIFKNTFIQHIIYALPVEKDNIHQSTCASAIHHANQFL